MDILTQYYNKGGQIITRSPDLATREFYRDVMCRHKFNEMFTNLPIGAPSLMFDASTLSLNDGSLVDLWVDKFGNTFKFSMSSDEYPNGYSSDSIVTEVKYYDSLYSNPCVRLHNFFKRVSTPNFIGWETAISCAVPPVISDSKTLFLVHSVDDPEPYVTGGPYTFSGRASVNFYGNNEQASNSFSVGMTHSDSDYTTVDLQGGTTEYQQRYFSGGKSLFGNRVSLTTFTMDFSNQKYDIFKNGSFLSSLQNQSESGGSSDLCLCQIDDLSIRTQTTIGGWALDKSLDTHFDIFELRLYDNMFSDSDRSGIESELISKWGIL